MRQDDGASIFECYASREDATRYMDFPRHEALAKSQDFADRCARCWETGTAFPWAIIDRTSDTFIGAIELRLKPPEADFGYILGPRSWGRGLGSEAATAVVGWTSAHPSISRIWATCHPDNHASARVLVKAGLDFERKIPDHIVRPQISEVATHSLVFARSRRAEPSNFQIKHLADCSSIIPLAAGWLFDEWGHKSVDASLERSINRLQNRATKGQIPFACIAFSEDQAVGIASVVESEDDSDTQGPWVSGVFIVPHQRNRGIATKLLDAIEAEAINLGAQQLLLSAAVPHLYESRGYRPTGTWKSGEPVMSKSLLRKS